MIEVIDPGIFCAASQQAGICSCDPDICIGEHMRASIPQIEERINDLYAVYQGELNAASDAYDRARKDAQKRLVEAAAPYYEARKSLQLLNPSLYNAILGRKGA